MATTTLFANAPDISADDYCLLGLATCFLREDGELRQIQIIEPIPSAALEALFKGVATSYQLACAKSIGEIFAGDNLKIPAEFPADAQFCQDFTERAIAACRTYKKRSEAKDIIPLGTVSNNFNYSLERKRVLNLVNVIRAEDNVKQHSHTHKVL